MFITNIQIINLNKKVFVKRYNVRKSQRFNFDSLNCKVKKISWLLIVIIIDKVTKNVLITKIRNINDSQ